MPQSNPSLKRTWLIVVALALLIAIPFAIQQARTTSLAQTTAGRSTGGSSMPMTSDRDPDTRSRRTSTPVAPPSHQTDDLKDFLIPSFEMKDVTLEEAMETLISHYHQTCRAVGESPVHFEFKVRGEAEPISYIRLTGDFLSSCRFIASMAATTLEIQGEDLTFTEVENEKRHRRRWAVPPTFAQSLPNLDDQGNPILRNTDPFAPGPPLPGIGVLLSKLGALEEDASVSYLPGQGIVTLDARMKDMVRLDGLVENSTNQTSILSRIHIPRPEEQPIDLVLSQGNLATVQFPQNEESGTPAIQFLISTTEKGFGREIKVISFPDELPNTKERNLYLETGNLADLGLREGMTTATYNVTRWSGEEHLKLMLRDPSGTQSELPFTSERIDASGQTFPLFREGPE